MILFCTPLSLNAPHTKYFSFCFICGIFMCRWMDVFNSNKPNPNNCFFFVQHQEINKFEEKNEINIFWAKYTRRQWYFYIFKTQLSNNFLPVFTFHFTHFLYISVWPLSSAPFFHFLFSFLFCYFTWHLNLFKIVFKYKFSLWVKIKMNERRNITNL